MAKIHYAKPSITDLEATYAGDAAAHGWGERCYEYIERFERGFCEHLGVRHAIATSSATGALHLGMAGLGLGPGDEVIAGDTNWIASIAPIVHLGATPVLVDVLPDSWCLAPDRVEAAITPRTRAILAVHLYGNVCALAALQSIAERHDLHLIEDAAEAIGSSIDGRKAGSIGAFGAFSFHGTKTMTTGEGGMFVTNDEAMYERVLTLSNHGRARGEGRQFWPERVGFKYKMSNVQAAIGCAQLERVQELVARKREIFQAYEAGVRGLPVSMNPEPQGTVNGYWMPTIVAHADCGVRRDDLLRAMRASEIDARVFFWPLSSLGLAAVSVPERTPIACSLSARSINLPSYHDMTRGDIDRVLEVLHDVFNARPS